VEQKWEEFGNDRFNTLGNPLPLTLGEYMRFNMLLGIIISTWLNIAIADDWNNYLIDSQGNPVVTQNNECVKTPQSPNTTFMWPDKCYNNQGENNINIQNINLAGDIMFAFNKAILSPQAGDILTSIIAQTDMYSLQSIEIIGHTDSIGSESYNQKLSTERAKNVANYFVRLGVAAVKIYYYGEGELNPIMPNTTKMGQAQNRRVTIKIR